MAKGKRNRKIRKLALSHNTKSLARRLRKNRNQNKYDSHAGK